MTFQEFLDKVIEAGMEGARASYGERTDDNGKAMLAGSLEGFEACRGLVPSQISLLLQEEQKKTREHRAHFGSPGTTERKEQSRLYWHQRCREAEVEWVANCVSAALVNSGVPGIVPVTARGFLAAARILGVAGVETSP